MMCREASSSQELEPSSGFRPWVGSPERDPRSTIAAEALRPRPGCCSLQSDEGLRGCRSAQPGRARQPQGAQAFWSHRWAGRTKGHTSGRALLSRTGPKNQLCRAPAASPETKQDQPPPWGGTEEPHLQDPPLTSCDSGGSPTAHTSILSKWKFSLEDSCGLLYVVHVGLALLCPFPKSASTQSPK